MIQTVALGTDKKIRERVPRDEKLALRAGGGKNIALAAA
jgi:hypothetical protein